MGEQGQPDREKLAAYVDGEYEGNDALAAEKEAIEACLETDSEAIEDVRAWRRLKQIWQTTTPHEPSEDAWMRTQAGIQAGCANPTRQSEARPAPTKSSSRFSRWGMWLTGLVAAGLIVGCFSARSWFVQTTKNENRPDLNGEVAKQESQTPTDSHAPSNPTRVAKNKAESPQPEDHSPEKKSPKQGAGREVFVVAKSSDVEIHSADVADLDIWVVSDSPVTGRLVAVDPGEVSLVSQDFSYPEYQMSNDPPMITMVGAGE